MEACPLSVGQGLVPEMSCDSSSEERWIDLGVFWKLRH